MTVTWVGVRIKIGIVVVVHARAIRGPDPYHLLWNVTGIFSVLSLASSHAVDFDGRTDAAVVVACASTGAAELVAPLSCPAEAVELRCRSRSTAASVVAVDRSTAIITSRSRWGNIAISCGSSSAAGNVSHCVPRTMAELASDEEEWVLPEAMASDPVCIWVTGGMRKEVDEKADGNSGMGSHGGGATGGWTGGDGAPCHANGSKTARSAALSTTGDDSGVGLCCLCSPRVVPFPRLSVQIWLCRGLV